MSDPALREQLIESVRRELRVPPGEPLPLTIRSVRTLARCLGFSHHKACDLARRGELPGQRTTERPFLFSTYALIQALLDVSVRVEAPDAGSPGLVVQQGSPSSNGRRQTGSPAEPMRAEDSPPGGSW